MSVTTTWIPDTTMRNSPLSNKGKHRGKRRVGSVLILVVALLVLLALMGTAYIAMARIDRYASAEYANASDTENVATRLLQQESAVVTAQIVRNVFGGAPYANTYYHTLSIFNGSTTQPSGYLPYDCASWASSSNTLRWGDRWLASNDPELLGIPSALTPPSQFIPAWPRLSISPTAPLFSTDAVDLPFTDPTLTLGTRYGQTGQQWAVPTSLTISYAPDPNSASLADQQAHFRTYPALAIVSSTATNLTSPAKYIAGDADGDGIADAGLYPLTDSPINGIMYYGALRVVDNAAKMNANIAWSPSYDHPSASAGSSANLFPCDVALMENLDAANGASEIGALNGNPKNYPYGTCPSPAAAASGRFCSRVAGDQSNPDLSGSIGTVYWANNTPDSSMAFLDQADMAWMQLGRCMNNPAMINMYYNAGIINTISNYPYRSFDFPDSEAFAHRNGMVDQALTPPTCDAVFLANDMVSGFNYDAVCEGGINYAANSANRFSYLPANEAEYWFDYNYNYDGFGPSTGSALWEPSPNGDTGTDRFAGATPTALGGGVFRPLRNVLTSNNPVSSVSSTKNFPAIATTALTTAATLYNSSLILPEASWTPPTTAVQPRVNLATAGFPELWSGFLHVMTDDSGQSVPQNSGNTRFRSPLRHMAGVASRNTMSPMQVALLRSAVAAWNVIGMRESDYEPYEQKITIPADTTFPGSSAFDAYLYQIKRQPFITEVLADTTQSNAPYIAVELFNPYTQADVGDAPSGIQLATGTPATSWMFEFVGRESSGGLTVSASGMTEAYYNNTAPNNYVIQTANAISPAGKAAGWSGIINWNQLAPVNPPYIIFENNKTNRPADVQTQIQALPSNTIIVEVPNLEQAIGNELVLMRPVRAAGSKPGYSPVFSYAPVDSIDLSSIPQTAATLPNGARLRYCRPNASTDPRANWYCSYAGTYPSLSGSSYQGILYPGSGGQFTGAAAGEQLGLPDSSLSTAVDPTTLQQWWVNEWYNDGWPGFNRLTSTKSKQIFPFGGFARVGDLLEAPYYGSYRIFASGAAGGPSQPQGFTTTTPTGVAAGNLLEMNTGPLDAFFTEDPNLLKSNTAPPAAPAMLQIGRFAPMSATLLTDPANGNQPYSVASDPHGWALNLFDYFTAIGGSYPPTGTNTEQYLPNVSPRSYFDQNGAVLPNPPRALALPLSVNNSGQVYPIEGQINVNTASWKLLSMLELLPSAGKGVTNWRQSNIELAKAIVYFRDVNDGSGYPHGPFKNLFELNLVYDTRPGGNPKNGFQNGWGMMPAVPDPSWCEFSANSAKIAPSAPVSGDFLSQYLMVNRVSNLLTTRSDCFTVYLVVQGWKNAGTSNAEMVVQKRTAFIIDRSVISDTNQTPMIYSVPMD